MKPPAFQFYADDFLSGTADMTTEEVGAYIRLLCHQWNKGGLPEDNERLARMAGYGGANGVAIAPPSFGYVIAKFEKCPDGMLRNERMEKVRAEGDAYRKKQAENGKAGANRRWKHGDPNSTAKAPPMATPKPNDGSPSPSPKRDGDKRKGTFEEVKAFCVMKGLHPSDGEWFFHKCEGCGWKNGGEPIISWKGTVAAWKVAKIFPSQKDGQGQLFGNQKQSNVPDYSKMTDKQIAQECAR